MFENEKTILMTGGAGFIGANFAEYYAARHPTHLLIDLDALTYAAHREVWEAQMQKKNIIPVEGDIRNADLVRFLFRTYDVTGVIHFAAESHVDNSTTDPLRFVSTNVTGTGTLLHEALRYWREKNCLERARFHHISTDEVYGSLGEEGFFTETTPYAPNSPYSSSKAASDHLVRAYAHTYGMNATISNCSNNYGPWQHDEKLIPTVISKALAHEPIPVYGNGKNVRDWLWVGDHCEAIELIFRNGRAGESYNVGGHNEKSNLEIVGQICRLLDQMMPWEGHRYAELVTFVKDRPGHDFRYAIDPAKIRTELGWESKTSFETGLRLTLRWYLTHLYG